MASSSTRPSDQYNDKESSVVKDLIWKDHISKIDLAQKSHDEKWGFLNGLQPQATAYDPKRSPRSLLARANAGTPRIEPTRVPSQLPQQYVKVSPSPRPVPSTTSSLIGWRTADKNCTLEKYGSYARGQESLHRKFKWPVEGFD